MRAAFIRQHGGPEVIEVGEVPTPEPGEGQVQVRVRAAALNRLDLYTRAGLRGTQVPAEKMPHVLGGDCAGEVSAVGAGVTGLRAGQRVVVNPLITNVPYPHMVGTHAPGSDAEYVVVPAANAVPIPDSLSYEQAAALPTVYLPTWSIIMREGQMKTGETALVLSASSGVGTAAIQIVKGVVGGRCIAVTSTPEKVAAARALGADETINYKDEALAERVKELTGGKGVDLVVDSTGALFFEDAYGSLARGGRYGICGVTSGYKANLHLGQLFTKELRVYGVFMGTNTELAQIVEAAGAGKVASAIHRTVGLEGLAEAHAEMERSEHFGKFVVTID